MKAHATPVIVAKKSEETSHAERWVVNQAEAASIWVPVTVPDTECEGDAMGWERTTLGNARRASAMPPRIEFRMFSEDGRWHRQ